MNKKWPGIVFSAAIICSPVFVFAETIILKSGQKIEGRILEKTDQTVKIEWNGIGVNYNIDEIASIDETKQAPLVQPEPQNAEPAVSQQQEAGFSGETKQAIDYIDTHKGGTADIIITFYGWDTYILLKPSDSYMHYSLSLKKLRDTLNKYTGKKELAVVFVGDVPAQVHQADRNPDLDKLEKLIKGMSIHRVAFERDCISCKGNPIIRSDERFIAEVGTPAHPQYTAYQAE